MSYTGFPRIVRVVFLLLLALSVSMALSAQTTSTKKTQKKTATTTSTQADAGQRVFIDPVTHKPYQPSAEEVQALDKAGKAKPKAQAAPKQFYGKRGGVGVKLDDSFAVYSVATKTPDGKLKTECVQGKDKANKAATQTVTVKEALDEK